MTPASVMQRVRTMTTLLWCAAVGVLAVTLGLAAVAAGWIG
jgi:hypothetical protein